MTEVCDRSTPLLLYTTGSTKTVLAHQWGTGDMEVEGHLTTTVMNEGQAKPSPHACDLCGRTFPFLSALTKHMLKHAKEKPAKAPADAVKLESSLGQTSTEIQEEQEEEGQRRGEEEVKKKEEEVVEGEEEEKEGGVPEEQEGCSSPTESTSACNRVVNGGGGGGGDGGGDEKDAVKTQRKGAGRKERSTGSPCPLRQRKLRSQTEQERSSAGTPEEEMFTCQLCGFEASSKEQLQNHEEKVHLPSDALASGEASPDEGVPGEGDLTQAGEYPCGQCDQVFTQAWFLKSHMKKHQGPLDHGCRICGRRFREPWFLRSHMKTHVIRAKPKAGDSETPATINGVAQDEATLVNDVCLYELCAKCGNFFQDRQTLWLHEQVHERVSGGRGCDAEKENKPLSNNASDSKTPVLKEAFLECLNLRPVGSTEKTPEEPSVNRIPELDPISSYQTWHLATRGRVVEVTEHGLGWEERLADADVAYDREKGEYVLLKQEKKKKQQLVATPVNAPSAAKKKKTTATNNGAGEKNGHGSSGDVSPESHSDSEYRPTTSNSRRASQNKTSECLECGKGFRSQQQMVIHMLIRHGGGSGFGAGLESSAPIFGDAALSFLTNAAFKDPKLAGQTKDTDKKSDRHSAFKHNTGSSSSHQQGSVPHSNSSEPSATRLGLAGESTEGSSPLEPDRQPDGLLRHRCPFCTHSTLYPEVLWIHQRVAHKVNSSSTLAPKWALRNGFKGPRSTLEFRRRTGPPPFLEGKDCPALTETRKPRTQPPTQAPSGEAQAQGGLKSDSSGPSEPSPSRSRGHLHKPSSSASSSSASNSSSKPKTSSSNVSSGSRKRAADSSPASNPSGTPKKPASHVPSPKTASRAAASSLLPQEGLHFVLASQHGHDEQGKATGVTAPSSQRREDSPAPTPNSAADSTLQNASRRAADTLGAYPADASQLDVLGFLKNCSPTELAALYHHWGLGTTAMMDQAGVARSLLQQMKYVCPVCGKSFSQPSHYRTHMRSHTGERPFRCRYCPYSASQKGNLKTHVQTVHRVAFDNTSYTDGRLRREAHLEEDGATTTHGPPVDQEDPLDATATDSQDLSELS